MSRRRAPATPPRVRGWFVADSPDFRHRGVWLALAFAAMAITLCARLFDVQMLQHTTLAARAAALHQKSVTIAATRGRILDSSGRVLVSNRTVYDVYADPGLIAASTREDAARQLGPVLSMDATAVASLISEPTRFVYLAKAVSQDISDRLNALNLAGVVVVPAQQRVYEPSPVTGTSFAANLLGYVDHSGTGQYGIESYYNTVLHGTDGHQSTVRDVAGNSITLSNDPQSEAHNGQDLQLGLDSEVQYWAEQAIAQGVATAQAASGTLIMMDTKTGVIRAWAQAPTYDANSYWTSQIASFRDLAVANVYEPGSVEKVVTFAGGLNSGAITPGYTFNEAPTTIDGYTIRDWDGRAHGTISMQTVLDESLNNGAIKVGQLMGANNFYSNLLAFGMGAPTGVDLFGEQNVPLPPQNKLSALDLAEAAFGQRVQVTPIEVLAAFNAVANGGVWVQPHAVQSVIDRTTGTTASVVPTTRRIISPQAAATLAQMMTGVVEDRGGEGSLARIPAFKRQVAGKTGTASVATHGQYGNDVVVSFGGFLPAKNPRFTMLVVLNYPHETGVVRFGATLAAPVWKQVAQVAIDQWRITP
ncbi:MAG: penicillin-binding protein 2 [Candidatus Dormibacteraeota bacterium]|uniref:Penicillin-binding protein 2 n=1 Tax=Candidatus Aeolococcus gillhamiae TaxID=3127015 RepID=A0A934JUY5_9BACT|nr:penicillin-binding protein 2 [Candidatus Dormibacteraeota bacterium]